ERGGQGNRERKGRLLQFVQNCRSTSRLPGSRGETDFTTEKRNEVASQCVFPPGFPFAVILSVRPYPLSVRRYPFAVIRYPFSHGETEITEYILLWSARTPTTASLRYPFTVIRLPFNVYRSPFTVNR